MTESVRPSEPFNSIGQRAENLISLQEGIVHRMKPVKNDLTRLLGIEDLPILFMVKSDGQIQLYKDNLKEIYSCSASTFDIHFIDGVYHIHPDLLAGSIVCDLHDSYNYVYNQVRINKEIEISQRVFDRFASMKMLVRTDRGFFVPDMTKKGQFFVCLKENSKILLLYKNFYEARAIITNGYNPALQFDLKGYLQAALETIAWFSDRFRSLTMSNEAQTLPVEFYKKSLPKIIASQFSNINGTGVIDDLMIVEEFSNCGYNLSIQKFKLYVFTWTTPSERGIQVNTLGKLIKRNSIEYYTHVITDQVWN